MKETTKKHGLFCFDTIVVNNSIFRYNERRMDQLNFLIKNAAFFLIEQRIHNSISAWIILFELLGRELDRTVRSRVGI